MPEVHKLIKEHYPDGFEDNLITIQTTKGNYALALPLETQEVSYLIKMPDNQIPDEAESEPEEDVKSNFDNFDNLEVAEDIPDED